MAIAIPTRVQPAKAALILRRLTVREVARRLGMSEQVLGRQLNGIDRATPRIRRGLAEILDVPESELFVDGSAPRSAA